jgi:hypothetical protein
MRAIVLALALAAIPLCGHADELSELKSQLDAALKSVQALQKRVEALEAERAAAPPGAAAPAAAAPAAAPVTTAGAPVVAPNATAAEGAPETEKARVEIFGQVMLDAIYDFDRVDPEWNATLRPSKIPVNCPGDAGCGKDGETVLSVRQSSLGVRGFIPTPLGELTTLLDFDLFASGGGNTELRLLDAWGELGWFGAGQYYTLFMDIDTFPNTIDYWGPSGMVFVRNPQLRFTPLNRDGMKLAFSLEAPGAAIDTGKVADVDPALGANVTGRTQWPDLIASLRIDREWGHVQAAGILRQVAFETPANAGAEPAGDETGYGLNLSAALNVFGKDRIVGALVVGRGIASYMNDGGVDLAPDSGLRAEAVDSLGWFAYYDHYWNERWSSSIGYSEHRQDNTGGQFDTAFKKGSYASANVLFYPVKNVTTGAELLWGERENNDGASGDDTRVQFSAKYKF